MLKFFTDKIGLPEKVGSHFRNRLSATVLANFKPAYFIRTTGKASVAAIKARFASIAAKDPFFGGGRVNAAKAVQ